MCLGDFASSYVTEKEVQMIHQYNLIKSKATLFQLSMMLSLIQVRCRNIVNLGYLFSQKRREVLENFTVIYALEK